MVKYWVIMSSPVQIFFLVGFGWFWLGLFIVFFALAALLSLKAELDLTELKGRKCFSSLLVYHTHIHKCNK